MKNNVCDRRNGLTRNLLLIGAAAALWGGGIQGQEMPERERNRPSREEVVIERYRVEDGRGQRPRELGRPQAGNPEMRRQRAELEARAAELRERMADAEKEGREQEVAEIQRNFREIRRQMAELNRPGPQEPGSEEREQDRRIEHVRIAIEHLHLAGFPDVAERLEREVDRKRAALGATGPRTNGPGPQDMQELRQEVRELGEVVKELRRAVQQLQERSER